MRSHPVAGYPRSAASQTIPHLGVPARPMRDDAPLGRDHRCGWLDGSFLLGRRALLILWCNRGRLEVDFLGRTPQHADPAMLLQEKRTFLLCEARARKGCEIKCSGQQQNCDDAASQRAHSHRSPPKTLDTKAPLPSRSDRQTCGWVIEPSNIDF